MSVSADNCFLVLDSSCREATVACGYRGNLYNWPFIRQPCTTDDITRQYLIMHPWFIASDNYDLIFHGNTLQLVKASSRRSFNKLNDNSAILTFGFNIDEPLLIYSFNFRRNFELTASYIRPALYLFCTRIVMCGIIIVLREITDITCREGGLGSGH